MPIHGGTMTDTPQEKALPLSDEELIELRRYYRPGVAPYDTAMNSVVRLFATITQARDDLAAANKEADLLHKVRMELLEERDDRDILYSNNLATVTAERDAAVALLKIPLSAGATSFLDELSTLRGRQLAPGMIAVCENHLSLECGYNDHYGNDDVGACKQDDCPIIRAAQAKGDRP